MIAIQMVRFRLHSLTNLLGRHGRPSIIYAFEDKVSCVLILKNRELKTIKKLFMALIATNGSLQSIKADAEKSGKWPLSVSSGEKIEKNSLQKP